MRKNKGIILGIYLSISLVIFDMIFVGGVSVLRYIMYDTNIITYDETNIHRIYNSEKIIGKTRKQIIWRYGKFDAEYDCEGEGKRVSYFVNWDNKGILGLPPSYIHDDYIIIFDENDVAIEAYFKRSTGG